MEIHEPIFIIGSGRSGTSLLYNLLAVHPDLCWFSNLSDRFARLPQLILLHRLADFSVVKKAIIGGKNFPLLPSEGGNIYRRSRFTDQKKTTEADLSRVDTKYFFEAIGAHLRLTGKARFLNKRTANTQRLRLMHALLPDAYWIHIIRDGRAVAHSLSRVDWWPTVRLWWHHGDTPMALSRAYPDPIRLAGQHWRRNVNEIRLHRRLLGRRYKEVSYEDLVKEPKKILAATLRFCHLRVPSEYLSILPNRFPNRNPL